MIAIEISRPGGPDVLVPVERPAPAPGDGEVLVRVLAAGVNRPDLMQREGRYPPPPGASDIPGLEVAGLVESVGAGVDRWHPGDALCALTAGGGYAELCAVPAPQCLPLPRTSGARPTPDDFIAAAAVPETFFTVWTNVFQDATVRSGETFLVHGGASGIGTTAVQLGRAFGTRVFATAGSDRKCEAVRALGAELAVNYRTQDFVAEVKAATGGRGVDVILDMVGGEYVARNLDALARRGRLVQIAMLGGAIAEIPLAPILVKRLTITGSTLRPRSVEEKGAIARDLETRVWPLLASGEIGPVIHATFPLERAADAHRLMESGEHIGKIVLTRDR